MSFTVVGAPLTQWTRLTDNTETTIFTASTKTTVLDVGWSETAGGTPTLTIVRDDGTNDHTLRGAKALTAYEIGSIGQVFKLDVGDVLTATSNDAQGDVHLRVTYLASVAGVGGDHH